MIMFNAENLVTGRRSAVLTPATTADRFQSAPGDQWHPLDQAVFRQPIYAVDHFQRYLSQVGVPVSIKSIDTGRRYDFQFTDIYLVQASDLTPAELAALGHKSRQSFDQEFGEALGNRRCWFTRLIPITSLTPAL